MLARTLVQYSTVHAARTVQYRIDRTKCSEYCSRIKIHSQLYKWDWQSSCTEAVHTARTVHAALQWRNNYSKLEISISNVSIEMKHNESLYEGHLTVWTVEWRLKLIKIYLFVYIISYYSFFYFLFFSFCLFLYKFYLSLFILNHVISFNFV